METIPKGSEVYSNGQKIAETTKEFVKNYVPKENDFNPPISTGVKLDDLEFYYDFILIYKHPDFI